MKVWEIVNEDSCYYDIPKKRGKYQYIQNLFIMNCTYIGLGYLNSITKSSTLSDIVGINVFSCCTISGI